MIIKNIISHLLLSAVAGIAAGLSFTILSDVFEKKIEKRCNKQKISCELEFMIGCTLLFVAFYYLYESLNVIRKNLNLRRRLGIYFSCMFKCIIKPLERIYYKDKKPSILYPSIYTNEEDILEKMAWAQFQMHTYHDGIEIAT